ncbi:MAG: SDR family NAD(P)-dependent oxidoreductase [Thermoleophilia bacterium]
MDLAGKRTLVTGADGFIGSHLAEALLEAGCDVRALALYNSFGAWGWLDSLPRPTLDSIAVVTGDVRDPHGVRTALRGVDVVFHLAALIAIPYSYHSPDSYLDTNVRGTLNVLQAARDLETERVLVTSTSEVFGTARYAPIDESHPRQGQSPYSATKIAADALAEAFHRSFGLPVTVARPFNTYGPRQSARAVIPTIIGQLSAGRREIHLGALHPTRDLTFVTDICAGFIALARCDAAVGRDVNMGSGREISIGDLARKLIALVDPQALLVADEERLRPALSEVERLLADSRLMSTLTGWAPSVSLDEGLARTVAWFAEPANLQRYKVDIYNV